MLLVAPRGPESGNPPLHLHPSISYISGPVSAGLTHTRMGFFQQLPFSLLFPPTFYKTPLKAPELKNISSHRARGGGAGRRGLVRDEQVRARNGSRAWPAACSISWPSGVWSLPGGRRHVAACRKAHCEAPSLPSAFSRGLHGVQGLLAAQPPPALMKCDEPDP